MYTDEYVSLAWGFWNRNNPDIKNVQYLMSCSINNKITLEFIKLIFGTDQIPKWDHVASLVWILKKLKLF